MRPVCSFQIDSATKEQWKLLLEQNSIGYIFPDDVQNCLTRAQSQASAPQKEQKHKTAEDDWQIIIPVPGAESSNENDREAEDETDGKDDFQHLGYENGQIPSVSPPSVALNGGIFPAARARLASLRDLGAKKIGALKLKLIENKIKSNERGEFRLISSLSLCPLSI